MKNEFYDIAFRKRLYHSIEQLQQDVDQWLIEYNQYRPHSGSRCYGKTPIQTFNDAKKIAQEGQLENHYKLEENISQDSDELKLTLSEVKKVST